MRRRRRRLVVLKITNNMLTQALESAQVASPAVLPKVASVPSGLVCQTALEL